MRKYFRPFCVILVAICVFCLSSVSVLADDSENPDDVEYKQRATLWHWVAGISPFLRDVIGYSSGKVCPESEDNYHHAKEYYRSGFDVENQQEIYKCTCYNCGQSFTGYKVDLKQSYEAQVAEMPATGYNSDGTFLIPVEITEHGNQQKVSIAKRHAAA